MKATQQLELNLTKYTPYLVYPMDELWDVPLKVPMDKSDHVLCCSHIDFHSVC